MFMSETISPTRNKCAIGEDLNTRPCRSSDTISETIFPKFKLLGSGPTIYISCSLTIMSDFKYEDKMLPHQHDLRCLCVVVWLL